MIRSLSIVLFVVATLVVANLITLPRAVSYATDHFDTSVEYSEVRYYFEKRDIAHVYRCGHYALDNHSYYGLNKGFSQVPMLAVRDSIAREYARSPEWFATNLNNYCHANPNRMLGVAMAELSH